VLIIAMLSVATLLAARWALRSDAGIPVFVLTSFVWGAAAYFLLVVHWLGVERVFNGESLEGLGVLVLLVGSAVAAAATTAALTAAIHRARTQPPKPVTLGEP
jgi:hypothetical protein